MADADKTLGVAITADLTQFNEQVDKVASTLLKLQEKKTAVKFAVPSEAQLKKLREYVDLVTKLNSAAATARGGIVESYPTQRAARGAAAGSAASGTVKVEAELKAVASTLRADIEEALKEPFDIHLRVANIEDIRKQIGAMEIPVTAAGGMPHAGPMPTTGPGNGMPTYRWSQGFQQQLANGGENMRKYIDNLYAGLNDARKVMGKSMLRDVGHISDATEKAAQQFAAIAEEYGGRLEDLVQFGAQPVYPQTWPKEELRGKPRPNAPRPIVGGAAHQIMQSLSPDEQQWFVPAVQDFATRASGLYSTFGGSQRTSAASATNPVVSALRENTEAQKAAARENPSTSGTQSPQALLAEARRNLSEMERREKVVRAGGRLGTHEPYDADKHSLYEAQVKAFSHAAGQVAEQTAKAVAERPAASIGLKESGQFTVQSLGDRFAKALTERQRDSAAPGGITSGVTASVTPVWSESRKRWIDPKTGRIRKAPPITIEDGSLNVAGEPMLTDSDPVDRARQQQQASRRRSRQRTGVPSDTTPLTLLQREVAGTGNKANAVPSRLAYRGVDFSDLLIPENVRMMMGMTRGISQENQGQLVRAITDNSPAAVLAGKAGMPYLKGNEKGNLPGFNGLFMGMNPQDVAKMQVYERLRAARIPELEIESVVGSLFGGVKKGEQPPVLPSGVASAAFPRGATPEAQVGALGYGIQQIVKSLGVEPGALMQSGATGGDAPAGGLVKGSGGYAAPDRMGRNGEGLPFEVTAARLKSLAGTSTGEFRDLLMQHLDNAVEIAYQRAQVTGAKNRQLIDAENAVTPDERVLKAREAASRVEGLDAVLAQAVSVWDDAQSGNLPTRYFDEQGKDLGPILNPYDEKAPVTTGQIMRLRNLELQQHVAGLLTDEKGNAVPARARPTAQNNREFLKWLSRNGYEQLGAAFSAPNQMYWSNQQMALKAYETAGKSSDTRATRPATESELARPPRFAAQDELDRLEKTYRNLFGGEAIVTPDPTAGTTAKRSITKSMRGAAAYWDEKQRKWIDPQTGKETTASATANRMHLSGEGVQNMGANPTRQAATIGQKDLRWFQEVEAALRKEAAKQNVSLRQMADPKVKMGLPMEASKLEEMFGYEVTDDRRIGRFSTYFENPDFARAVHARATKSFRRKYGDAPEKRQEELQADMARQRGIIQATQQALRGEDYDPQYEAQVQAELARQAQFRTTGNVGKTLDRRGKRGVRTSQEDARAYAKAGGVAAPGTGGPVDLTGAAYEAEARRQAGSGVYQMASEDIHPSLRSSGGGGGRVSGNGRAPGDNGGRAFGGVIDVRIVGSTITVPVSMRGAVGGKSGNLTPETIRANFAANNPGASDEDIDAAVAALTGQKAKGTGKAPGKSPKSTRLLKGRDQAFMVSQRQDPRMEAERMYAGLFDEIEKREEQTRKAAAANQKRAEAEYAEVFAPVFQAEDEAKARQFAKGTPEQRRGIAMYEDLFNQQASGAIQVGRREDLGADPAEARRLQAEEARRARTEAMYTDLFNKADAGVVQVQKREDIGKPKTGRAPAAPRPISSSGPKTPKYAGPPTPSRLRAELGAAGVPEADIEALIAARTRPLGSGSAGSRPDGATFVTPEDQYIQQGQARLRKAANVNTSRSLGTTGIQLAQTFFGGKEQAAAATIAYNQELADYRKIAMERKGLQQGLGQAQERVARGTAIKASGKGGKELEAELADAAKSVEDHTNALKDNGLALEAQKKVVDTLAKDLPGVGAAFKNVAAGFVGGIGGGFIVSMMGAVTSLIGETIEKGLVPQLDRRMGNGLLTAQQNREFAGAVAQGNYTTLGVRQQLFEQGFGTSGINNVLPGLMLGAGGIAGGQQTQARIDATVAAMANARQAAEMGLPQGVSPQTLRSQGSFLSLPNPFGGYVNFGGEGSYEEKLRDFLRQIPEQATSGPNAQMSYSDFLRSGEYDKLNETQQYALSQANEIAGDFGFQQTAQQLGIKVPNQTGPMTAEDMADKKIRDQMLQAVATGGLRAASPEEAAAQAATYSGDSRLKGLADDMVKAGVVFTSSVNDAADAMKAVNQIFTGKQDLGAFFDNANQRQIPNMMFQLQKQFEAADRSRQYGVGLGYYAQPHLAVGAGTNGPVGQDLTDIVSSLPDVAAEAAKGMAAITANVPEAAGLVKQYEDMNVQLQGLAQASADIQKAQAWRDYTHNVILAKRAVGDLAGLVGASGASEIGQLEKLNLLDQRRLQILQFQQSQRGLNYQRALAGFQYEGDTPEEAADRARIAREQTKYQQQELNINRRIFGRGVQIVDKRNLQQFNDAVYQLSELQKRFSEGNRLSQMAQTEQKVQEAQNMIQGKINNLIQREEGLRAATMDLATAAADATGQTIKAVYDEAGKWLQKAADLYKTTIETANQEAGITPMIDGPKGEETVGGDSNMSAFAKGGGGRFVFNLTINNPVVRDDNDLRRLVAEVEKAMNRKAALMGMQRLRAD